MNSLLGLHHRTLEIPVVFVGEVGGSSSSSSSCRGTGSKTARGKLAKLRRGSRRGSTCRACRMRAREALHGQVGGTLEAREGEGGGAAGRCAGGRSAAAAYGTHVRDS